MNWPGFLGPSYTVQSVNAAAELTMNLYPEPIEVPDGKTRMALYGTPGLVTLVDLSGNEVRGCFAENGRAFAAVDGGIYQVTYTAGVWAGTLIGAVLNDGLPVTFASNGAGGNQLMITSGGNVYIYNFVTGVFAVQTWPVGPVTMCDFTDGYFLVLIANSATFQISNLEDGTASTGPNNIGETSEGSDNLVSLIVNQRTAWLLGSQTSEPWFDFGTTFPFQPISGGFLENGCAAAYSAVRVDSTPYWIQQNERGARVAVRANNAAAERVSTFAVEYAWAQYATVADAISWAYQEQGHTFWVIYFPTGNATWVYDVATQQWHQRSYLNPNTGMDDAYLGRCHMFAFNTHIVGARNSGKLYAQALGTYDYDGTPIHWVRRTTHLCQEQKRQTHRNFQVDCEVGVGLTSGQGSDPKMTLRWSDDGGHRYSNGRLLNMGPLGQYRYRAYTTNLGQTRDRVYELSGSEPVKTALLAAYLTVQGGTS